MARIIAITNQKGGVGKTTTSINLAASLCQLKRRVLLVDMDPQGNATSGSGLSIDGSSVYNVLLEEDEAKRAILHSENGYDVMGSDGNLAGAQVELINEIDRDHRLKNALSTVVDDYDFILIDCPPSLNVLTLNALVAAQKVFIPMQCEFFALEGLSQLIRTIEKVKQHLNPQLEIEGVLRTMYDTRTTLATEVNNELQNHFGEKLYRTLIPRNVRLAEAPGHGLAAINYEPNSAGAQAYLALAGELLRREDAA